MADARFFKLEGPFTIEQLAKMTSSQIDKAENASKVINDVADLEKAGAEHMSFFDNKKYLEAFKQTKAGMCFVRPEYAAQAPSGTVCLINKNPYKAYAVAAAAFYPDKPDAALGISDSAVVDPTAEIGTGTIIKPGAVIEAGVKIGNDCVIGANAVIGQGVQIGNKCKIGANATLLCAIIGNRVTIYPNAVIGRPGFGFAIDYETGFTSVPQLGRVIIEDDVFIGSNSTIDRGAGPDTVIGMGTRIDNLVQIGHNVKIGRFCVIVAQVGISGSSKIEDYVMLGGQAGVAGHLTIGSGVKIAAKTGVTKNIPAGMGVEYMGTPAIPLKQFMRQAVTLAKLTQKKGLNKDGE